MPPKKKAATKKVTKTTKRKAPASKKKDEEEVKKSKIENKDDVKNIKKEEESEEGKNIKKIEFSGVVPVDEHCVQCKDGFVVYKEDGQVYNSMLNQTNIGFNNNKYYLLQLLKSVRKHDDSYSVWFRWGRVGKIAGTTHNGNLSLPAAKAMYKKKYKDKTGNDFDSPLPFTKIQGKYDLLQMDYGEDNEKDTKTNVKKEKKAEKRNIPPSKLHVSVQKLIELLFDVKEFEESVKEMQYDVKKAPLGKLTSKQIKAGFESLKKIEACINGKKSQSDLCNACSEFYTRIPHDFGMKVPPLIRTSGELKKKIELLEALSDIQIALKLMEDDDNKDNPIDKHYDSLNCHLEAVDKKHEEYKMIQKYIANTHGSTHRQYNIKIEDLFRVKRDEDEKRFKKEIGNRKLLWHGSRMTNWCGILRQGLRIAPPEAPVTGYMFGKGVYFADMVSKSANYCYANQRQPNGFLLLSEVALGNTNDKKNADYNAHKLPKGKHSTKGVGRQVPNEKDDHKMPCGTIVPLGKETKSNVQNACLYYNEYIVYDVAQIRPRFLVKAKFEFGSSWF